MLAFVILLVVTRSSGGAFLPSSAVNNNDPSSTRAGYSRSVVQLMARKKKNKYAQFSKADKLEKDPLDTMIDESLEKNRLIHEENSPTMEPLINPDEPRKRNEFLFPSLDTIDPYDPTTYGYIELGLILGAHGVKGEVKLRAETDFSSRLTTPGLKHLKAPHRRSPRRIELIEGRWTQRDEYLLKLDGILDRDTADKLRGSVLYAREEDDRPNIDGDEFIVKDLVGLEVYMEDGHMEDMDGKLVGVIKGVVLGEEMSSIMGLGQDLIELALPKGPKEIDEELVLIPFVPQIVPSVDFDNLRIYITPPEGLLDLTYVREKRVKIKGFLPPAKED